MEKYDFVTRDTKLASVLITCGHIRYHIERKDDDIYFCFKDEEGEIPVAISVESYYQQDIELDPYQLFSNYESVKNRVKELLRKKDGFESVGDILRRTNHGE